MSVCVCKGCAKLRRKIKPFSLVGKKKLEVFRELYDEKATSCIQNKGNGKAIPLQALWPRGWVELQLYSSMTAALEGGERSAARPAPPHFTPGKNPVPILQEAEWATGPVWTGGRSRPHRDSIPDRPTHSHSLYRLSYRAQRRTENMVQKF